jgi:23S rRNA (cytidine2498-2'-O)-methyltransferase
VTPAAVLVAHCRAGFEPEAAADLTLIAAAATATLEVDAVRGRGFVVATPSPFDAQRWPGALAKAPPIFVRSLFFGTGPHTLLGPAVPKGRADRLTPLTALIQRFRAEFPIPGTSHTTRGRPVFGDLRLETPDTNDGKELSGLTRSLAARLVHSLANAGAMNMPGRTDVHASDVAGRTGRGNAQSESKPNLHVLFVDGAHAYIGASVAPWASPWPMGIPRLHLPRAAPSRSTLKLAEAFRTFLGSDEREAIRAGMRAVDLGAAPGGWTWQLAQRGVRVTAVDNGALKGEVADDALVTHVRADGLTYRPRRPVAWLVCDIADQPSKIASVVAEWLAEGLARRAIFNLKLPMKKRYDEVLRCERIIAERLHRSGMRFELRVKQLYHDREEVTGYCARED